MFNQEFFEKVLPAQISAKGDEGSDQPSLRVQLHSGSEYAIYRIAETGTGWVFFDVYPPKGKAPRKHHSEDRKAGAPQFDFDRIGVPYGNVSAVVITLERKSKGLGFQA